MVLTQKNNPTIFVRYLIVGVISALLVYGVWQLNTTWSPDMRLWKALGGATFALLWFTAFIGPIARLWRPLTRFVTWRRETGIWFALLGLTHGYLILDGWVRWGGWELLGYKYIPELETYLRSEPGFGLANLLGVVAIVFALVLAATSFDRAIKYIGARSWKALHTFTYVIFYLIALHTVYFAFIHYAPSPERVLLQMPTEYPENVLRWYYLFAIISVLVVQILAFIKVVSQQKKG